jgi:hypothetical protein
MKLSRDFKILLLCVAGIVVGGVVGSVIGVLIYKQERMQCETEVAGC